jgi:hypothetical protein
MTGPHDVATLPRFQFEGVERGELAVVAWPRRTWLNSRLRLLAPPEARARWLDLLLLSFDQDPAGTLPHDPEYLGGLLGLESADFVTLMRMPWSPIYGWRPVRCQSGVRLTHPLALEILEASIDDGRRKAKGGRA